MLSKLEQKRQRFLQRLTALQQQGKTEQQALQWLVLYGFGDFIEVVGKVYAVRMPEAADKIHVKGANICSSKAPKRA